MRREAEDFAQSSLEEVLRKHRRTLTLMGGKQGDKQVALLSSASFVGDGDKEGSKLALGQLKSSMYMGLRLHATDMRIAIKRC